VDEGGAFIRSIGNLPKKLTASIFVHPLCNLQLQEELRRKYRKEMVPWARIVAHGECFATNHGVAACVMARRGLGCKEEKVPRKLLQKYIKNKEGFTFLTNWKKWSAIKKAAVAAIKKQTRKEVKSLVSWQHHRKQLTTG